jgi:lipid-binding SYLF domain-containing protein
MTIRSLAVAALALAAAFPVAARAQQEQQTLVDRATLTVQEIMGSSDGSDPQSLLKRARGVMVCPRVFRAAFLFGGSGGTCVLVARDGSGSWSYPAFYGIGSGSAGFQIGIQDSEMMILILTPKGLASVMDAQFRFGGDASLAFATLGGGVEGATTPALGADIVVAAKSRGLFAGVSLQGTSMTTKTDWDQAYYGRALAARQIVVDMQVRNPGADPLREMLTRYGAGGPQPVAAAQPSTTDLPPPGAPQPLSPPPASAPIQQQSLPPPRRY